MDAVVLDLFGTLVDAPTPGERTRAASRLAQVIGRDTTVIERYFRDTWQVRHDGTLPTVTDLAAHLVRTVGAPETVVRAVVDELLALGRPRLSPDVSVVHVLESLRETGVRLGVLSDASAEIAAAWSTSPLATLVDAVVFSCQVSGIKPDPRLYARIHADMDVPACRTVYVGDGGGDELRGALDAGMTAVAVGRRGPDDGLVFGDATWSGPVLETVEQVPSYLTELP